MDGQMGIIRSRCMDDLSVEIYSRYDLAFLDAYVFGLDDVFVSVDLKLVGKFGAARGFNVQSGFHVRMIRKTAGSCNRPGEKKQQVSLLQPEMEIRLRTHH